MGVLSEQSQYNNQKIKRMNKIKEWLLESNHLIHLLGGLVVGLMCGLPASVCVAAAFEIKDCHHDNGNASRPIWEWNWRCFDWSDFWFTVIGGIFGAAAHVLLLYLIFK